MNRIENATNTFFEYIKEPAQDNRAVLAIYVDNILVFTKTKDLINDLYTNISKISRLEINNLEEIKEFLGIEIIRHRSKKFLIMI